MLNFKYSRGQDDYQYQPLLLPSSFVPRLSLPNPPNLLLPEPQLMGLSLSPPLFVPAPTKPTIPQILRQ